MADEDQKPTQQTQPAQGEPVEIPVPKREDVEALLSKAAKGSDAASGPGH
jgi:hypothetical protein